MRHIPLIKPYITQEVKDKVIEVLDSGHLTEGPVTRELEKAFKNYIGCSHAIAVTSCTTGLEVALRVLEICPGDEVIVPDYTYPATANVVNIVGATAVIVDVNPDTMLIDYDAVERAITKKTKTIIPVSIFGNPLNYERLNLIKSKNNLKIIEDAACSIGAAYRNSKVGTFADISVFSLHPRKFITTGEGGIITTDNDAWANWMNSYKHFGMGPTKSLSPVIENPSPLMGEVRWGCKTRESIRFDMIGTNYKLSNLQAAVGVVQMQHVDTLLTKRKQLADKYVKLLKDCLSVRIPKITTYGEHSYQSFCVFVEKRDEVIKKMKENGIETQIGTYSLHMHKAFNDNPLVSINGDMKGSRYAFEHCLTLPLYHEITDVEQKYVVDNLITAVKNLEG